MFVYGSEIYLKLKKKLHAKAKTNVSNVIIFIYLFIRIGDESLLWKWQIPTFFMSNIVHLYSSRQGLFYTCKHAGKNKRLNIGLGKVVVLSLAVATAT